MTSTPVLADDTKPAASLAAAEFAFAARSVATDMREAFLSVLAEDAILFRPGPVKSREAMIKSAAPPIELNWRPTVVHVAASGELGFSTGPARIVSKSDAARPAGYAHFLSIWKLDTAGVWKLQVDIGINHVEPFLADAWLALSASSASGPGEIAFHAAEKVFSELAEKEGYAAALSRFAAVDVRVYRNSTSPMLGKAALSGYSFAGAGIGAEILESGVAKSGDLAWAVVKLAPRQADGGLANATAHALRIWRAREGKFELAVELLNEIPQ